jgi:uncharacterized delta-60 repeat protein
LALVRYKANGALDTAFGGDGWATTRVTTEVGEFAVARAMALQLNGKIVVAGVTYTEEDPVHRDFLLARYNANGTLDTAFGDMGLATADFGGSLADARALIIQPYDGRLVAVGSTSRRVALARYHAITCNEKVATRVGTLGNDTIVGTSGNDVIVGFAGNDLISGLGGNDVLCGGSGNDTLRGGGGNDLLDGDTGTDKCDGGPGSGDRTVACEQVTNVP